MPYIQAKKSLGQNFLTDRNIIRKIVESFMLMPQDVVIEIGPGTGAITGDLLGHDILLIAVEIDRRACDLLSNQYQKEINEGKLILINDDILKIDLSELRKRYKSGGKVKVIGNIPYNISSSILFHLLKYSECIEYAELMVQKEVAQRFAGRKGSKDYGITSVAIRLCGEVRILFDISPGCFQPQPKVTSSMILIKFSDRKLYDFNELMPFVKTLFNQRRKMIRNTIKNYLTSKNSAVDLSKIDNEDIAQYLQKRPEELDTDDFIIIHRSLEKSEC